jgi:hypothetical protein
MPKYILQEALDYLPTAYNDAILLNTALLEQLETLTETRRLQSGSGSGRPTAPHLAINRAIVVAAVGGLEAYFERLAEIAVEATTMPRGSSSWFPISGNRGAIQTPSPDNIRKLFWSLFHIDLEPSWDISVGTSGKDHGEAGTWRGSHNHRLQGADATKFFHAMLQVRHSFAHMEPKQGHATGMATRQKNGKVTVQSHHAFNAVSAAMQISIQSTMALGDQLETGGRPRWKLGWKVGHTPISYWLIGSPLWDQITNSWAGQIEDQVASAEAASEEIKNQTNPSLLELP